MIMRKAVFLSVLLVTLATGCRRTGFVYADTAASELGLQRLSDGFRQVPDSVPGGRRDYLLSQGIGVADIVFYSDGTQDAGTGLPEVPAGFHAACIGTAALLDSLHVSHGLLFDDSGANFRALVLLDSCLTFPVLDKIANLAAGGAFIAGVRPSALSGPGDEAAFRETVDRLWRSGNVISGVTLRSVLSATGALPDMKTRPRSLLFKHRHLPAAEIYHVVNPTSLPCRARLKCRVVGRRPEIWDPATGEIRPVSYKLKKKKTKVVLPLDAGGEAFLVFGSVADRRKQRVRSPENADKH